MKLPVLVLLISFTLVFYETGFAQAKVETDTLLCNTNVLLKVSSELDSLNSKTLIQFFTTFDSTCESNIEYSEWSNELLFKVLERHPEQSLKILEADHSKRVDYILAELEDPLLDVDIKKVYIRVHSSNRKSSIKSKVLSALQSAATKMDNVQSK